MEKSKAVYLLLRSLYDGKALSPQEYGLSRKEYAEALELMQKKNLITGAEMVGPGTERLPINNRKLRITAAGVNYLMENTIPDREYKMQVSVNETAVGTELGITVDLRGKRYSYKKTFSKPPADIDIETEAFILASEGLKREKQSTKHAV